MAKGLPISSRVWRRLGTTTALSIGQARLVLPQVLQQPKRTNPNVIVSLTTFPPRIGRVKATLESIYRQSTAAAEVVLVLSREEFSNQRLPREIEAFRDRGMRVLFQDGNSKSYKKLIPVLEQYPDRVLVTADDDVIYPRTWLEDLLGAHRERPSHVLGHRGTVILGGSRGVEPYLKWPRAKGNSPSSQVFLTGMGGILYPAGSLPEQVADMKLAMKLCPTADDIWFKAMELLAGTQTAKISDSSGDFPSLPSGRISALNAANVDELQNDVQFAAVMNYFDLWDKLFL